jgi:hypothetical protein
MPECGNCGKWFCKPYLLKRHLGKKFPCNIKGEKSEKSEKSEKKLYSCKECSKNYSKKMYLDNHFEKFHQPAILKIKMQSELDSAKLVLSDLLKTITDITMQSDLDSSKFSYNKNTVNKNTVNTDTKIDIKTDVKKAIEKDIKNKMQSELDSAKLKFVEIEKIINDSTGKCITCLVSGKVSEATHGKLFEEKTHCKEHCFEDEFYNNKPKCDSCPANAMYGNKLLDKIPRRCEEHIIENDMDLVSRECISCNKFTFIPSKEIKCQVCKDWSPDKNKNKKLKLKELKVKECLLEVSKLLSIPEPIYNKAIIDGCSQKRPDFFYNDFNNVFSLIVEVDEFQHSKYTCSVQGELIRMINLYEQDYSGGQLIFIRFNPDEYYSNNNLIKDNYQERETILKNVIMNLHKSNEIKDYQIGIIYLYYDNFESVKIEPLRHHIEDGNLIIHHKHPLIEDNYFKLPFNVSSKI